MGFVSPVETLLVNQTELLVNPARPYRGIRRPRERDLRSVGRGRLVMGGRAGVLAIP